MTAGVAELVMTLALRCLARDGNAWGQAMRAEFDVARREGGALGFACGCLIAAWRRMPLHAEGRIALAGHAVTLGLIVPLATFHLGCVWSGARFLLSGRDPYHAMLMAGGARGRMMANAYAAATPALTLLLFLLGAAHLAVAWFVLDGRWRRAAILWVAAMIVAAWIVHITTAIIPDTGSAIQFAALAIESAAIPLLAGWRRTIAGASQ